MVEESWLGFPLRRAGGQSVERTGGLLQAGETDVGVAAGGVDGTMAEQTLDQHQVGAGIEQVGGKTAARRGAYIRAGPPRGGRVKTWRRSWRRPARPGVAGKQPHGWPPRRRLAQLEQERGDSSVCVPGPLAVADVNDLAWESMSVTCKWQASPRRRPAA